ncbi:MAG: tRNA lysidine(34) synthetase TilS [Methylobacteriaceae bacterium]|nr:tRNA lysidine(34) synthetase TilS [Methylobacteriaceae bacterium]MBV9812584.1 tRNA lysidine(34) synthetase TilS [Acetobacteraceae bacterium]
MDASAAPVGAGLGRERILAPLSRSKGLLLAVSGGPDSVALMLLAAGWSGRQTIPIEVATVDHGLRSESRTEAEKVAGWAKSHGFRHHLLTWEGDAPNTRVQERARDARYALLSDCASRVGADRIVTAHHADDQAETVLLRLTRGSGPAGLAGMAPFTPFGEITVARPLLDISKADLVALCEAAGQPFIKDPSNDNPAFARTRLRALRGLLDAEGLDRPALLRLARRAARAEAALAEIAAATRLMLPATRTADGVQIAGEALAKLPDEILLRILEAEVLTLSPDRDHLRLDRLERAAEEIAAALRQKRAFATTLGDARIAVSARGEVEIARAPARRVKADSA